MNLTLTKKECLYSILRPFPHSFLEHDKSPTADLCKNTPFLKLRTGKCCHSILFFSEKVFCEPKNMDVF